MERYQVSDAKDAERPGPRIRVVECKGCGRCVIACPRGLLRLSNEVNERGYRYVEYVGEGCIGCGGCFYTCPEPHAIEVHAPSRRGSESE